MLSQLTASFQSPKNYQPNICTSEHLSQTWCLCLNNARITGFPARSIWYWKHAKLKPWGGDFPAKTSLPALARQHRHPMHRLCVLQSVYSAPIKGNTLWQWWGNRRDEMRERKVTSLTFDSPDLLVNSFTNYRFPSKLVMQGLHCRSR